MPKQIYKIDQFHGGLNSNSDPRDISNDESVSLQDVVVDEIGLIRNMGGQGSSIESQGTSAVKVGSGLFAFRTDKDGSGNANETSWYALYNNNDAKIDLLDATSNTDKVDAVNLGSSSIPSYYFADGGLRVSDSNFGTSNSSKSFKYIESNLFQTTNEATSGDHDGDGESQPGTPFHAIGRWSENDMSLKTVNERGITVVLHDGNSSSPTTSEVTSEVNKIIISHWKTSNGDWNGVYELGICLLYDGQESRIYTVDDGQIGLIEEKLNFQIYLCTNGSTKAKSAAHILGDDRIDGMTIYFRPYGEEKWNLLQKVDLKSGGRNNWLLYDTDKSSYGMFNGSVVLSPPDQSSELSTFTLAGCGFNSGSSSITHPVDSRITTAYKVSGHSGIPSNSYVTALTDSTHLSISPKTTTEAGAYPTTLTFPPQSDTTGQFAYRQTTITVNITNSAQGFTGRTGFLRLYGFAVSPIYSRLSSLGTQTITGITVINPNVGTQSMYCELLDEQFNLLSTSDKINVTFTDAGYGPPPRVTDDPSS